MRHFIILIVSILSVNFAPAVAKTSCFAAYGCVEFFTMMSPSFHIGEPELPVIRYYHGTELMSATGEGSEETIKLLISEGAEVNAVDNVGSTALMWASGKGRTEIVELLISKGADVNAVDNDGSTALMRASGEGHTEIAAFLILKNADVNAVDNEGETALMSPFYEADYRIVNTLGESYTEIAELLISKGVDVNTINASGETVLDMAIEWGNAEVIKFLKSHKAIQNK